MMMPAPGGGRNEALLLNLRALLMVEGRLDFPIEDDSKGDDASCGDPAMGIGEASPACQTVVNKVYMNYKILSAGLTWMAELRLVPYELIVWRARTRTRADGV